MKQLFLFGAGASAGSGACHREVSTSQPARMFRCFVPGTRMPVAVRESIEALRNKFL